MNPRRSNENGTAMVFAIVVLLALMGVTAISVSEVSRTNGEHVSRQDQLRCWYVAEAGVQNSVMDLSAGRSGNVGLGAPIAFGGGEYSVSATDNGDGTFTLISRGRLLGRTRVIEATVNRVAQVFDYAIFAGNRSRNPAYVMDLGGSGLSADQINGDVYSGNNLLVTGNAAVNGEVRASGLVSGITGLSHVAPEPIPDLAAMNYATNHDVNVTNELATQGSLVADDAGGIATQVPLLNPAHMFRMNPTDRLLETVSTVKNDYFLEDPYEQVRADAGQDGSNAYRLSFGNGSSPARRVYYIDGNLWIHNKNTYSFILKANGGFGTQATLVVRGNVYISDNLYYDDPAKDGMAFIAIKDPAVVDSGNIYFGDPRFGTLQTMSGFMYAENHFFDNNLGAAASRDVRLTGTMSAGETVSIQRTFAGVHSRLQVDFDRRIRDGIVDMPGIPQTPARTTLSVMCLREVSSNP